MALVPHGLASCELKLTYTNFPVEYVLASPRCFHFFLKYGQRSHADENLVCWKELSEYEKCASTTERPTTGKKIYDKFFSPTSSWEATFSHATKTTVAARVQAQQYDADLFDKAKDDINRAIRHDLYRRFLGEKEFATMVYTHLGQFTQYRADAAYNIPFEALLSNPISLYVLGTYARNQPDALAALTLYGQADLFKQSKSHLDAVKCQECMSALSSQLSAEEKDSVVTKLKANDPDACTALQQKLLGQLSESLLKDFIKTDIYQQLLEDIETVRQSDFYRRKLSSVAGAFPVFREDSATGTGSHLGGAAAAGFDDPHAISGGGRRESKAGNSQVSLQRYETKDGVPASTDGAAAGTGTGTGGSTGAAADAVEELPLRQILADSILSEHFLKFCKKQHREENPLFFAAAGEFAAMCATATATATATTPTGSGAGTPAAESAESAGAGAGSSQEERLKKAKAIVNEFVKTSAPLSVSLDAKTIKEIESSIDRGECPASLFDSAVDQSVASMRDSHQLFLRDPSYVAEIKARKLAVHNRVRSCCTIL